MTEGSMVNTCVTKFCHSFHWPLKQFLLFGSTHNLIQHFVSFVTLIKILTIENLISWQLRMTLDSIRNSCDVFFPHIPLWFLWYLRYFCLILHISAVVGLTVPQCLGLVRSLALPAGIGTTSYKYGTKRRYWQVLAQSFVAKSLLAQKLGIEVLAKN